MAPSRPAPTPWRSLLQSRSRDACGDGTLLRPPNPLASVPPPQPVPPAELIRFGHESN
ncbi:hypothetical protein Zm00014a_027566 [Zea mays]|uniref:Uncharacterized protein n=1 Tax=Zea mays TaxID=4577 RepID=A0A3L6EZI2_MAIZE|nr:hypothetical protein Zm00014a_027566 [Zea mays]